MGTPVARKRMAAFRGGVAQRCVAQRCVAQRGVAQRGVAQRGVAPRSPSYRAPTASSAGGRAPSPVHCLQKGRSMRPTLRVAAATVILLLIWGSGVVSVNLARAAEPTLKLTVGS